MKLVEGNSFFSLTQTPHLCFLNLDSAGRKKTIKVLVGCLQVIEWFTSFISIHSLKLHCGVSQTSQDLIRLAFKRSPFCLPYHLSSRLQLISSEKPFKYLIVPLIFLVSWSPPWHQQRQYHSHTITSRSVHAHTLTMPTWDHLTSAVHHKWVIRRSINAIRVAFRPKNKRQQSFITIKHFHVLLNIKNEELKEFQHVSATSLC